MKYMRVMSLFLAFFILTAASAYAGPYQAFSLLEAKKKILSNHRGIDFRTIHRDVYTLGSITKPEGMVFDTVTGDVIVIGMKDRARPVITLDDFVTALRTQFIHKKWPLVSFDPTETTEQTGRLAVRFEGGVKDTQFGKRLYDVDYFMKKLILGLNQPPVPGVKSYWDLGMEKMQENPETMQRMNSRLWFNPVLCQAIAAQDVIKTHNVQLLTGLVPSNLAGHKKIGSLSPSESAAHEFAKNLRENFGKLIESNSSFSALESMARMVAMAKASEEMGKGSSLTWWINSYQVNTVRTPLEVKVQTRSEEYRFEKGDKVHRGERKLSGGIQLKALVVNLQSPAMEAFKNEVLKTRPTPESLTWNLVAQ